MSALMERGRHRTWEAALQAVILTVLMIVCMAQDVSCFVGLKYFVFQLLGILLPGSALLLAFRLEHRDGVSAIAISYCLGLMLLVAQYLLLVNLHLQRYSFWVSGMAAAVSFAVICRRHSFKEDGNFYAWPVCLLFVVLVLLLGLFTVAFVNTMPNRIDSNAYDVDFLYWVGNNISLTKGFPPQDFRLCGETYKYHYFSSIVMAQTHFITGIDIRVLSFYFSFVIPGIMLVTTAYTLLASVLRRPFFVILALMLLLFTEGNTITYISHLYICPFGYDYGYALGMLSIYVLCAGVTQDQWPCSRIILSALLIFMTTGFKGPVGVVILMGFAVAAFCMIGNGKYRRGILLGILWLGAFLLCFFLFVFQMGGSGDSGLQFLGIREGFRQNPWVDSAVTMLAGRGLKRGALAYFIALLIFVYSTNRALMALTAAMVLYFPKSVTDGKQNKVIWILLGISLWGVMLTVVTHQSGYSEMYFIMTAIPYGILGGFYVLERVREKRRRLVCFISVIVIGMGLINFHTFCRIIQPKAVQGILCVRNQTELSDYAGNVITHDDWEAYEWLRVNTDSQDIAAIDYLRDGEGNSQQMTAGVFSERYIWNDGKYSANVGELEKRNEIMKKLLEGNQDMAGELGRKGVSYFMQNLQMNPDFKLMEKYGEVVFENNSFRIYDLTGRE